MSDLDASHNHAQDYRSDDDGDLRRNPVQPALNTLFSEFARRHRSLSPSTPSSPHSARAHVRPVRPRPSTIDLRALEYTSVYDAHLMCPICHVPFVDPIVLDCDHTFCSSCFNEYRYGATASDRSQCPSCRRTVLTSPRKASRLIYNMCNDIKVLCPNQGCTKSMARGYIETHATKNCPEQQLSCPDPKCEKATRRRNYVPGQCVHNAHVECDCGAVIELGQGQWLRHKDEDCPSTRAKCDECGEWMSINEYQAGKHVCQSEADERLCPGAEFGCTGEVLPEDRELHLSTCPLARIAPHLRSQSRLLQSVQEQLASSKLHNANLEAELERMNSYLTDQIQPKLDNLTPVSQASDIPHDDYPQDHDNDVEEIPRDSIPSAAAMHHRDLLLPAHIHDLTTSPDLFSISNDHSRSQTNADDYTHMHNHLLSLHESLRHTVSDIEADIHGLHHALSELDARTSMHIMNETLRIKEDLAYTNASLVSHRSQVQWLLNRERMGREQAILRERGRLGGQSQQNQGSTAGDIDRQTPNMASPGGNTHQQQVQSDGFPFPVPGAGMTRTVSGNGSGSGPSSASTSPVFSGIGLNGSAGSTRRPSMRGGSQERVKL